MLSSTMLFAFSILSMTNGQTNYACDRNASCGCSTSPAAVARMIGGETARNNTWGWAVSLLLNSSFVCGATLISSSWILTSSSCLESYRPSEIIASAATNQLLGYKQWRYASVLIKHPDYDSATRVNDIALIQVSPPFNMSDPGIAAICLPLMATDDYPIINTSVSGFLTHCFSVLIMRFVFSLVCS